MINIFTLFQRLKCVMKRDKERERGRDKEMSNKEISRQVESCFSICEDIFVDRSRILNSKVTFLKF